MGTSTLGAAGTQALAEGNVSGAQLGPAETEIAQRIAAGLLPTPTSPEGWVDLVKSFTSENSIVAPSTSTASDISKAVATSAATSATPSKPTVDNTVGTSLASGQKAFVAQMAPWAQYASQQTGLDANLILSQWGNETGWGTSHQWTANFNPAGIGITSDAVQGQSFGSIQGGVQAYINFLNGNSRYGAVKAAKGAQAQAIALGNSGWAAGKYDDGGGPGSSLLGNMAAIGNATNGVAAATFTGSGSNSATRNDGVTNTPDVTPNSGSAVSIAMQQVGVPYQWGGEAAGKDFDCSGLVQYAFGQAGVKLPRVAQDQYNATQKVPQGQAVQAGDLVFFGSSTSSITHVGIALGNGMMLDAPHTGAKVRVESMAWPDYVGATRPADPAGSTIAPATPQAVQGQTASQGSYQQALSQIQSALNTAGVQ
jgi:cell wall-associated NlpC family hydrolase